MNKKEYKEIANIFRKSLVILRANHTSYICWTLPYSALGEFIKTNIIMYRLEGEFTAEAWLASKGINPRYEYMYQWRIDWLKQLIKEFDGYANET